MNLMKIEYKNKYVMTRETLYTGVSHNDLFNNNNVMTSGYTGKFWIFLKKYGSNNNRLFYNTCTKCILKCLILNELEFT